MLEYSRSERVGAEIRRELAQLLAEEAKDTRLRQVTVQEVRVTRDLSHAKVYYTVMDTDRIKEINSILSHAANFLRRRLGEVMRLRSVPQLHFVYDTSIENGLRLSALIEQAVSENKDENE